MEIGEIKDILRPGIVCQTKTRDLFGEIGSHNYI